jgi:pimeloyl-ACP methyl ester carboxylesterase
MGNVPRLETRVLDLGPTTMRYHVTPGDDDRMPVVLLHPWFGCWRFWARTAEGLPDHPCHLLDLYSIGEGDWRSYDGPEALAEAVLRFLDAEGIERCALAGNSMGGIAAQALAAARPERIAKLVLIGTGATTAGIKPDFKAKLDAWIAGDVPTGDALRAQAEELVGGLLARRPSGQEWETYVQAVVEADKRFMATVLSTAFELDLRPRLGAVTAETLVVRGEHDAARTREHVRDLLAGIRDSQAVELPGAGHSPMVDSPDAFVTLLRAFLEGSPIPQATRQVA